MAHLHAAGRRAARLGECDVVTSVQTYNDKLLYALRLRNVPGPRIAEVLAEVDSHVAESGEDPCDAFGEPGLYAEQVSMAIAASGQPSRRHPLAASHALAYGLASAGGAWLLLDSVSAWTSGRPGLLGL